MKHFVILTMHPYTPSLPCVVPMSASMHPPTKPHAPSFSPICTQEARTLLRGEVQSSIRCIRLLESTFFGGWKMEALLRQAAWISKALLGVAGQV